MVTGKPNNLLMRLHRWARKQDENFTTEAFVHLIVVEIFAVSGYNLYKRFFEVSCQEKWVTDIIPRIGEFEN